MTNLTRALLLSGLMLLPLAGEAQAQRHNRGQRNQNNNQNWQQQRRNNRAFLNGNLNNGASLGRYNQSPVINQGYNGAGYQPPTPATGRVLGQPVPQTDSVYDLRYR